MTNFKDSNILVTGGAGFIGSHLVEELVGLSTNVIVVDQFLHPQSYFSTKQLDRKSVLIYADVCDFDKVFDIVTKHQIDYIFHLAAQPLVEVAYSNPRRTLSTNILGTANILESARLHPKVKGVIVASSDKAYGKKKATKTPQGWQAESHDSPGVEEKVKFPGVGQKYLESDPLHGDHPYEVSKSSADLIAQAYFKTYNLPIVITRFGNIYGEGDLNFSRIIPGILKSVIDKSILEIRSDGKYVRDYLYVKDVVAGYLLIANKIDKIRGEAFNFGSFESLSVLDLIHLASKILRKKINYKILNTAVNEIPFQSLDYSKVQKKIGWEPEHSIVDTFKKIMSWYEKNLF